MWLLVVGGFSWHGVVCSTWIVLSRASTGRSDVRPLGNRSQNCVAQGNLMVSRATLMIRLGLSKYCDFAIEQPDSSLLGLHPRMRALQAEHPDNCKQVHTYMGNYNGPTVKGTILWGPLWLQALATSKPKMVARKKLVNVTICKRTGKKQMTGSKDLKSSQEYTREFGQAVAAQFAMPAPWTWWTVPFCLGALIRIYTHKCT